MNQMNQVSVTRSELLARRARITLAIHGRDLLKDRRSLLVRELHRIGVLAMLSMENVDHSAAAAGQFLALSIGAEGREPVESAGVGRPNRGRSGRGGGAAGTPATTLNGHTGDAVPTADTIAALTTPASTTP